MLKKDFEKNESQSILGNGIVLGERKNISS
jgi:hypothetical protein